MRYFLIGYKSSGKSTMGRKLSRRMKLQFIDLDEVIEKREGKTVPELYTELGDDGFRIKEWEALKELVKMDNVVVALGGGAPCHCDNMNLIEKYGEVIYLRLDNDTLVSRLKTATVDRPIVMKKSDEELRYYIQDIRNRCEHHYLRAKYVIDSKDLPVDKLIDLINEKSKQV